MVTGMTISRHSITVRASTTAHYSVDMKLKLFLSAAASTAAAASANDDDDGDAYD